MSRPEWVDVALSEARALDDCRAACARLQARLDVAEQELAIARTQRDTERALRTGALR